MAKPVYKRVLLKISGEALAGDKHTGLDFEVIGQVCDVIKECLDMARCEKQRRRHGAHPGRPHGNAGHGDELPGCGGRV